VEKSYPNAIGTYRQGSTVTIGTDSQPSNNEFGLADLVSVLIGNWKLLAIVPIIVGFAVQGLANKIPGTYTSVTVVNNMNMLPPVDPKIPAFVIVTGADVLLRIASVLDEVAVQFPIAGKTPDIRRLALEKKISVTKPRLDGATTLRVTDEKAETAKSISMALVKAWVAYLRPRGAYRAALDERAKGLQANLILLQSRIKVLEQDTVNKDTAIALSTLYSQELDLNRELINIAAEVKGRSIEDVILSGPTLPDEAKKKIEYAGVIGALLALLFVTNILAWRAFARSVRDGSGQGPAPAKARDL
jgi:hypothetical protein